MSKVTPKTEAVPSPSKSAIEGDPAAPAPQPAQPSLTRSRTSRLRDQSAARSLLGGSDTARRGAARGRPGVNKIPQTVMET
jgi:hypothetical protein